MRQERCSVCGEQCGSRWPLFEHYRDAHACQPSEAVERVRGLDDVPDTDCTYWLVRDRA